MTILVTAKERFTKLNKGENQIYLMLRQYSLRVSQIMIFILNNNCNIIAGCVME